MAEGEKPLEEFVLITVLAEGDMILRTAITYIIANRWESVEIIYYNNNLKLQLLL